MKSALLKISILLNLGLLGGLICLLTVGHPQITAPSPAATVETKPSGNEAAAASATTTAPAEPKPFCWSQLNASDYHIYVKNLRNIGCPEPTIRAIVAADVHAVCELRRRGLTKQLADLSGSAWPNKLATGNSVAALRAELQQLPSLETTKIADLMGLPSATQSQPNQQSAAANMAEQVSLPMVFQDVDLAAMNLDQNQIQVINDLRQSFMDNIGGPDQNPDDPAYLARWQQAQPETDALLRVYLGTSIFQNYQVQLGASSSDSGNSNLFLVRHN